MGAYVERTWYLVLASLLLFVLSVLVSERIPTPTK